MIYMYANAEELTLCNISSTQNCDSFILPYLLSVFDGVSFPIISHIREMEDYCDFGLAETHTHSEKHIIAICVDINLPLSSRPVEQNMKTESQNSFVYMQAVAAVREDLSHFSWI